jgi:3',5'-cyclic AMP phosphodiesterase CpdA
MSDLHLVGHGRTSLSLDTALRFEQAVACLNARYADDDFCIIAGDLADTAEAEAYARLKDIAGGIRIPTYITLGNHDDRATYLAMFG